MLEIRQLTQHCWYTNSEPDTDRPSLGYILSESGKAIVVDAGNSPMHYREFLAVLDQHHLPHPSFCLITHWHWDHTLGIPEVAAPVIASDKTQSHLKKMEQWTHEEIESFYEKEEFARAEYPSSDLISPKSADIVFTDKISINLDDLTVEAFHVDGPHSDDSTLIYIPKDGMVFAGDSSAGNFSLPNIAYDPYLLALYTDSVSKLDFNCFLHSHREPLDYAGTMRFLQEAKERGYYTF